MKIILLNILCLTLSFTALSQKESILKDFKDSSIYKIVIRTEVLVDNEYIAMDNLTARVTEDTVKIYYMHYGNGDVSSLMIPYSVYDQFLAFEQSIIDEEYSKPEPTNYSIKFEIGSRELRIPIDILLLENLSNFRFSLED